MIKLCSKVESAYWIEEYFQYIQGEPIKDKHIVRNNE